MPQVGTLNTMVLFAQLILILFLVKLIVRKYPDNPFSQGITYLLS